MRESNVLQARLPWRVRICYGVSTFSKNLINVIMAGFMSFFYIDVLGIDALVAAGFILAAKIWDIINDPMMGILVDRTKPKKEGRCRFWVKRFSLPTGIALALCWFVPSLSKPLTLIWVIVTYVLQGMGATVLQIPVDTLLGRMTSDHTERARFSQISLIFGLAASYLVGGYTMMLVGVFGGGNMRVGFGRVGILYGTIYALCYMICYWGTRGYEPVDDEALTALTEKRSVEAEQASLGQQIKALTQNKVWVAIILCALFLEISVSTEQATLPFYFRYNFPTTNLYPIYSTCTYSASIIPLLLLPAFVKKFGNVKTATVGCVMMILGYLFRFAMADASVSIMAAGWMLSGFGNGLMSSTLLLIVFDSRTYGVWKTGTDNDAVLMAGLSSAVKIGLALGGPLQGVSLKLVPYVANAAAQDPSVLRVFFVLCTGINSAILLIPLILYLTILRKNEKNLPMMYTEIEARSKESTSL